MKLSQVLDKLNSLEKNSFIKIIDNIITEMKVNRKKIDSILTESEGQLKNIDNENISKVFNLVEDSYINYLKEEFVNIDAQTEVGLDIILRDGNCIMHRDWFSKLYEQEINTLNKKVKEFEKYLKSEESDTRLRDYKIYKECVQTAFYNDLIHNREPTITIDEKSILDTLAKKLGLSHEEVRLLNAQIIKLEKTDIDNIIKDLKEIGVMFYSKKNYEVYIPDEIIRIIRKIRGKEVADKYFRRVLKYIKDSQVNLIAKRHNIDKNLNNSQKIKSIINQGANFTEVISEDIFKENQSKTDRKKFIDDLIDKLKIKTFVRGVTMEDKINIIIDHFDSIEKDTKVGIAIDGYEKLLIDLDKILPNLNDKVRYEFELQSAKVLNSKFLLDYNIKPSDILDLLNDEDLKLVCEKTNSKTRGDNVQNILDSYKDSENIFLENYVNIGKRDFIKLKDNGISIKESELGIKYEELTKLIFSRMGFNVDESLRRKINNTKNKIDIILNLVKEEVILIECKTSKDRDYNKFSSVSRQLKAYQELVLGKKYNIIKTLLVADNFSDDFINECEVDFELNLSLIKSSSLIEIYTSFKNSKHKKFPINLIKRDVLINEERIIKALMK